MMKGRANKQISTRRFIFDIPLHKKEGSGFILWMIAFMIFLACMVIAGYLALSQMVGQWETAIEGQVTVQIPASEERNGEIVFFNNQQLMDKTRQVEKILNRQPGILEINIIPMKEIQAMVSPWLHMDGNKGLEDIPLPALVTARFENEPENLRELEREIRTVSPTASLETHDDFLSDFLFLLERLKTFAATLTLAILATAILAVAGGARTRLSMHFPDIELLHLMGANDRYIARQFQWHAAILTFTGGLYGFVLAAFGLYLLRVFGSEQTTQSFSPEYGWGEWTILACIPLIACMFATFVTKLTALRFLRKLP